MDARRFRTEPWMASTKIPKLLPIAGLFFSGRPFLFGDFFFGPAKKKSLGLGSGRRPALYRKPKQGPWIARFARPCGIVLRTPCALRACPAFAGMTS
jgi:hypothetical protein